jgi:hypothetical protein
VGTIQPLKESARTQHCRMLDLRRHDVLTLISEREERALDREVVCFAAAAREENLVCSTA